MIDAFFRFPHTPHLMWLGEGAPRHDKVLSGPEAKALLAGDVVVEEKIDGANLGFSLDRAGQLRAQNRGQYLQMPYGGQFSKLLHWSAVHSDALVTALPPGWIAFGEWCAAKHSLTYDRLPDWWLLFDLYDSSNQKFQSTSARAAFAKNAGIATVAELFRGQIKLHELRALLLETPSRYRAGPIEGLIVRREDSGATTARAKLVRPDFTQAIERHWRSRRIEWNSLGSASADSHGL
ncbi:RNA ligase family protein [Variovorax sp. KK3]|uniref:RNA ligase family protein n=1 Tax=Variovorax sp. KK3 TaxID=1855728 RepID=UPI00097CB8EC|nr:RNA ligase family protein [Variovorax sp. KK3]